MRLHIRYACNQDAVSIRQLVFSTLAEYGLEPDPSTTDADLDDIQRHYRDSGGAFLVLVDEADRIVGSAGLFPLNARDCELRKMYIETGYRAAKGGDGDCWSKRFEKLAPVASAESSSRPHRY
jgi:putative acetyltransferase